MHDRIVLIDSFVKDRFVYEDLYHRRLLLLFLLLFLPAYLPVTDVEVALNVLRSLIIHSWVWAQRYEVAAPTV